MGLEADLAWALPEFRSLAESRMTSRCTIRRKTGATTTDVNGLKVDVWAEVYTDLPFRLGGSRGSSAFRTIRIGESETQVALRVGNMPADTSDLKDLDLIDVTDGENAGAVVCIAEASWHDQATARRVPVFEVQRPAEWA